MTMELLSYRFQFRDEKHSGEGFITEPEVMGQVIFNYKIKMEKPLPDGNEWYETAFYAPFSLVGRNIVRENGYKFMIWEWDGNRRNPTLNPSVLFYQSPAEKLHLFVQNGQLIILGDTTMIHDMVVRI